MNRTFFLAVIALLCAISAHSQSGNERVGGNVNEIPIEDLAMQQTEAMSRVLALDSAQYQLIYIMNYADISAFRDSMRIVKAKTDRNREMGKRVERRPQSRERFEQRRKIADERRQKRHDSLRQILSAEQFEKYLEFEKSERARWRKEHSRTKHIRK